MKHQLKSNKTSKISSNKERKPSTNNSASKARQCTIDSWFNKSNLQVDSFTKNIKAEPSSIIYSPHRIHSEIPLVCLDDDSEEKISRKAIPPSSFSKEPRIFNNETIPNKCSFKLKNRGLMTSLSSVESKNSSLYTSVFDDKVSSDSDFDSDLLCNFKKTKIEPNRSSVNALTNVLLKPSINNSKIKREVPLECKNSSSKSSNLETKVTSPVVCSASSSIKISQKQPKTNEKSVGKIKSEILSLKKEAGFFSSGSIKPLTSSSKLKLSQPNSPLLETRENFSRQFAKNEKNPQSSFKQNDHTPLNLKQEKIPHCEPTTVSTPTLQNRPENVDSETPFVDTAVLDLFKQQFMGGKATRKKRIFSDCQEEEILMVDLDRTEVLTIPTTLKKQTIPKKQPVTKKRTYKPRASREANNFADDNSENNRRPSLREIYFRSKVNGRYNKKLYSDLKQRHGYSETTRSKRGNRRKTFKKKKKA